MKNSKRVFFALRFDDNINNFLEDIQEKIARKSEKIRKVKTCNLHMTVKFLSNVNKEQVSYLKDLMEEYDYKKLKSQIIQYDFFDRARKNKLIYARLSSNYELDKIVDFFNIKTQNILKENKNRLYHITLARDCIIDCTQLKKLPKTGSFYFKDFVLYESIFNSKSVNYKILKKIDLENASSK
ncbi:MAG: RNA 2',3'-cyclic phosphodiesterase [Tissierellia bacterium]|nr:RNA 2',3'-cyclic phosphodiesterase [Tissierellia bacterium]